MRVHDPNSDNSRVLQLHSLEIFRWLGLAVPHVIWWLTDERQKPNLVAITELESGVAYVVPFGGRTHFRCRRSGEPFRPDTSADATGLCATLFSLHAFHTRLLHKRVELAVEASVMASQLSAFVRQHPERDQIYQLLRE
ncbi:antirestriction protein [Rubrivivax rivuli]